MMFTHITTTKALIDSFMGTNFHLRSATCLLASIVLVAHASCGAQSKPDVALAEASRATGTTIASAGRDSLSNPEPVAIESGVSDYRLAPRDQVIVEVFNQPDLRTSQRLTENGEIRLPLIGRVDLRGLTLRQAEARVEELYRDGGFIINPEVILSLEEYSDRFVSILGQVRNPSQVTFPPETNTIGIVEAITQAGGFTRIARTDSVQITRRRPDGTQEQLVVDVEKFLRARGGSGEFQLMPGDRVFVPERVW